MNLELRPMSTSQVLDRTFWLYRHNFWLFAGIAALPPALGLVAQLGSLVFPRIFSNSTHEIPVLSIGIGVILFALLYLVGYALATGASVYAVSNAHLGKEITIGQAYKAASGRVVSIILTGILVVILFVGLGVGCGLLFTGVVGTAGFLGLRGSLLGLLTFLTVVAEAGFMIWLFLRLAVVIQACVLEELGAVQSIKRSFSLTRGTVGRMLAIVLLYVAVVFALILAFSTPLFLAALKTHGHPSVGYQIGQQFGGFLAGTIATPISLIAFSLIYYDQRVRKEAFDLTLMMEAIGQAPPARAMSASAGTSDSIG